jgi:hypothetical protein
VRRFLGDNSLSLVFAALFLAAFGGQSYVGWEKFNEEALAHRDHVISYGRYVLSSDFGVAVLENWQSEYLQFFLFIAATIWLVQKGSTESKEVHEVGLESDERQLVRAHAKERSPRWARVGGWRTSIYSHSLLIAMGLIFVLSWFGQSVTGWTQFNEEQRRHDGNTVSWGGYLTRADFWERSLQNWQSEFLAVGTLVVFSIYLRERGSPQSKPVGAPHAETSSSG